MRRKMRKPNDMRIRQFVNHLHWINYKELPQLPPFGNNIVLYGIPKSWIKEMDCQDFDPFRATNITQVVDFCKRLESAEEFNPDQQKRKSESVDPGSGTRPAPSIRHSILLCVRGTAGRLPTSYLLTRNPCTPTE
jgi:hypothetical protein